MIAPIRPEDVTPAIPDWVIAGANKCIKDNYKESKKQSHFTQDELMDYVLGEAPEGTTRSYIFDNDWLDIEPIYRQVGWEVTYDKPPYYDTRPATFSFKKK